MIKSRGRLLFRFDWKDRGSQCPPLRFLTMTSRLGPSIRESVASLAKRSAFSLAVFSRTAQSSDARAPERGAIDVKGKGWCLLIY
jgi:hypothetical protein